MRKNAGGRPFVTRQWTFYRRLLLGLIPDADELAARLTVIPGVVEHGLFIGLAKAVICAGPEDIEIYGELG